MTATINSKYRSLDYISKKIKKFPNFEEYLNSITVNTAKNYKLPIEEYIDTLPDVKLKDQVGLYYAIYLQKNGDYKKAISLLRAIEIFASEKYNIPTKVAYAYKLSSAKEDIRTNSYLKVKKIDLKKIEENIGDCNN